MLNIEKRASAAAANRAAQEKLQNVKFNNPDYLAAIQTAAVMAAHREMRMHDIFERCQVRIHVT